MQPPISKMKTSIIVLLICLSIVVIEFPLGIRSVHATTRTVNLLGFVAAWTSSTNANPPLTVFQGDIVTINAKVGDGVTHLWFIDINQNGVADCGGPDICSSSFSTSNAPPVSFTVPNESASYTINYYCAIHPGTMHGSFTARSLTNVGGARYAE